MGNPLVLSTPEMLRQRIYGQTQGLGGIIVYTKSVAYMMSALQQQQNMAQVATPLMQVIRPQPLFAASDHPNHFQYNMEFDSSASSVHHSSNIMFSEEHDHSISFMNTDLM